MHLTYLYTILSVVIISLLSMVGIISLLLKKEILHKLLLSLIGLSAGALLGDTFLHILPEAVESSGFTLPISLSILAGVLVFFIMEKSIHAHHCEIPHEHPHGMVHESHKYHIGILNLFGDGLHNFLDGLAIASAYIISIPVGVATTIAVVLHEIPQEVADFGVLLYSGFSKKKALFFNFLSAVAAIAGAIIGLLLGKSISSFALYILPFTAGGFLYLAGSNLIPELHKECGWKESIWHIGAFILGIGIMWALRLIG